MTANGTGYRRIAGELRDAIERGDYQPGDTLPTEHELSAQYGVNRTTTRRAIAQLRAEGLVAPIKRRGTVVRERTPVRVPFSRYGAVLRHPGELGPWETACAAQGISGQTEVVAVERTTARDDVARQLEVPEGTPVVYRRRHMWAGQQVAQIQQTWMPLALVDGTPLAEGDKIVGGVYRALATIGHPPATVDEQVSTRMPKPSEAEILNLDQGSPVLVIDRVTRGQDTIVLEALRVIAVGDRVQLVYENLPLSPDEEADA